jgi:hypothetical protein
MKLTSEQKSEIERCRAAGIPIMVDFTPEQSAEYRELVAREMASKDENIEYVRRWLHASNEAGFSGDLRRAIIATGKPPQDVALDAGLDADLLDRFSTGEAILPSDVIDRLAAHLGLKLVSVGQ